LEKRGKELSKECNPLASGKETANALKGAFSSLASGDIKGFVGGIFDTQQGILNTTKASFGMADTLSRAMAGKLGNLVILLIQRFQALQIFPVALREALENSQRAIFQDSPADWKQHLPIFQQ